MVLTSQSTEVRNKKGEVTGRWKYGGTRVIPEIADIHGNLVYDPNPDYDPTDPRNWVYYVEKCRVNIGQVGAELENPTFKMLMELAEK